MNGLRGIAAAFAFVWVSVTIAGGTSVARLATPSPTPTATPTPSPSPLPGLGAGSSRLPGDCNGDGLVRVDELMRGVGIMLGDLPLASCEAFDLDGDGRVTIDELIQAVRIALGGATPVPPTPTQTIGPAGVSLLSSSPAHGEAGVAITRETILRFSGPLDPDTVTPENLYIDFAGGRLVARFHFSPDRRTLTLFYDVALPASSRIRLTIDGNRIRGADGMAVDANRDGRAGGVGRVEFDTLAIATVPGTAVCGRIFASELVPGESGESINVPLEGVTILVDGMEDWRAVTDQNGNFRLEPAPAGRFFVFIKGTTASNNVPPGAYYPNVGKAWTSVAGLETNIGEIYLPLIQAGTLQPVSSTQETVIRFPATVLQDFPEFADVRLAVPADALYADDGTRGGMVGIAPVAPDRIPSRLPAGLELPLVITVQTDGPENFDVPVSVCFPNLPQPATNQPLAPGAESALWSFNHDTGEFEVVGAMRVTADGRLVCTEPGVGILAPGWHGTAPGTSGSGGPIGGPPAGNEMEKGGDSPPPGAPTRENCERHDDGDDVIDPVYLFSGEFYEEVEDLRIKGRGLDFVWSRKYRSKLGPNTRQGNGWDFSYNIFIEANGADVDVCDGNSRRDTYFLQAALGTAGGASGQAAASKTWSRPEFFRDLMLDADGSYTMLFADGGVWDFNPLDGSPAQGRLRRIADRHGNNLRFAYDASGRLSTITDTLDRNVTVAYNAAGFIASVTDFAGRRVEYQYYNDGDAGGSHGDLRSVRSPAVTGTPNGNDFPNGKLTTYTYSKGFADARLNHNLLTITDGRRNDPADPTFGQGPYLRNEYASTQNPNDPSFDRIIRQTWGDSTDNIDLVYAPQEPSPKNRYAAMKTILNDRNGNVKEYVFDHRNRAIGKREYTGRADPDKPTTQTTNRPAAKLRPDDPDFFETLYEWNADSLMTRVLHPNGNVTEYVYESDLDPGAPPVTRGNLRIMRRLPGPLAGDQTSIEERFEYDPRFGCAACGGTFVTRHADGRGNETRHQYDERGNRVRTTHRIPSIVEEWEYNAFGQMTAHVLPDNGGGSRRRDESAYYDSGPQRGYMRQRIVDAGGLDLTTTYEYDAAGNVVRRVDPRGNDTLFAVNQLDQVVRVSSRQVSTANPVRHQRDFSYDANGNVVRIDVQNVGEAGQVQANTHFTTTVDYERLNRPVRVTREVDAERTVVMAFEYDANRNRVLTRFGEAAAGRQPGNVLRVRYDERDMRFREIAGEGTPEQSTTQYDYDANGNPRALRREVESEPRVFLSVYDGYNRLLTETDPMGNVVTRAYDANGNLVRLRQDGELEDAPGGASNVRLAEAEYTYDAMDRRIEQARAFFDPATQEPIGDGAAATQVAYNAASQVVAVTDDNGGTRTVAYDTANRLHTLTDAKQNQTRYEYDSNGNVTRMTQVDRSDLQEPDQTFVAQYAYDQLDRVVQTTDSAGNTHAYGYDSRGNRVLSVDARGNRTRFTYDGLNRLTQIVRQLTDSGEGGGTPSSTVTTAQEWDDSSRLTSVTDGRGQTTRYEYDSRDRQIRELRADGTKEEWTLDVHSNRIARVDANASTVSNQYDLLDRVILRTIERAPGVLGTTEERFAYDGASRVVRAENDGSTIGRRYDSLSNLLEETVNGRTISGAYDGEGNRVRAAYPGGRVIETAFDALDRPQQISDQDGLIAAYAYRGRQRVRRRDMGNGTHMLLDHDAVRRVVETEHLRSAATPQTIDGRSYAWDGRHNQIEQLDLVRDVARAYNYDSLDRLVESITTPPSGSAETLAYALDAAGNRIRVDGGPAAGVYEMSAVLPEPADAQVNQYTRTPVDARQYDANGNLISIDRPPFGGSPEVRLGYDYRNRLVRHEDTAGGIVTTYAYDAVGRRIERTVNDGAPRTTRFVHDRWREIEEQDGSGATQATYVHGPYVDELITMRRGGDDFYFHADSLYNVVAVTDGGGNVVERYEYGDYGEARVLDPSGAPRTASVIDNSYLFSGRRFDAESGLYHYRMRYLDPVAGRFTSRDPLGAWWDRSSLGNAFTYAGNNPRSRLDPYGLAAAPALVPVIEVTAEMIVGELAIIEGGAAAAGGSLSAVGVAALVVAGAAGYGIGTLINWAAEDYIQWGLDRLFGDGDMPDPWGGDRLGAEARDPEPATSREPTEEGDPVEGAQDAEPVRERCQRWQGLQKCELLCIFWPKDGCDQNEKCPPDRAEGSHRLVDGYSQQCRPACGEALREAKRRAGTKCDVVCGQI
jgi:RHS repeat-associated protein